MTGSLPPAYFEALYAADPDPWQFAASPYEAAKYAATLAALPRPRYAAAFEAGCSIGVLTRQFAARCDRLLAVDAAAQPLRQASQHCADLPHVTFRQARLPAEWPDASFDLIVLSEIAYYWNPADLALAAERIDATLASGGDLLLVHWTDPTDYPLTGDQAASLLIGACAGFTRVLSATRAPQYRLDLLRRTG